MLNVWHENIAAPTRTSPAQSTNVKRQELESCFHIHTALSSDYIHLISSNSRPTLGSSSTAVSTAPICCCILSSTILTIATNASSRFGLVSGPIEKLPTLLVFVCSVVVTKAAVNLVCSLKPIKICICGSLGQRLVMRRVRYV